MILIGVTKMTSHKAEAITRKLNRLASDIIRVDVNFMTVSGSIDSMSLGDEGFFTNLLVRSKRNEVMKSFQQVVEKLKQCEQKYYQLMQEIQNDFPEILPKLKTFYGSVNNIQPDHNTQSSNIDWYENMTEIQYQLHDLQEQFEQIVESHLSIFVSMGE